MLDFLRNLFNGRGEPMPNPYTYEKERILKQEREIREELKEELDGTIEQHNADLKYYEKVRAKFDWLYECQHPNMENRYTWKDDIVYIKAEYEDWNIFSSSVHKSFTIYNVVEEQSICYGSILYEYKGSFSFDREMKYHTIKRGVIKWYIDDKCKEGVLRYIDEKIMNIEGFKTKSEKFCERIHASLNEKV